jgi:hypothetical protein
VAEALTLALPVRVPLPEAEASGEAVLASAGLPVRGYVSCAVGCPYSGAVAPAAVGQVSDRGGMDCDQASGVRASFRKGSLEHLEGDPLATL